MLGNVNAHEQLQMAQQNNRLLFSCGALPLYVQNLQLAREQYVNVFRVGYF